MIIRPMVVSSQQRRTTVVEEHHMRFRPGRSLTPAIVAFAVAAGALVAAAPAQGATTVPPWEPDPQGVGTITFYDASGNAVTSGATSTAPFAAYAVGSRTVRAGDTKAALVLASPAPGSPTSSTAWNATPGTNPTNYPISSGPSSIQALSQTLPVATGASGDLSLDDFASLHPSSTHVVQVRLVTSAPGTTATTTYDVADLAIDSAAHTWTQLPSATFATAPGALGALFAVAHNASVNLGWTAPADGGSPITGYSVLYRVTGTTAWTAVAHAGTGTTQTVAGLTDDVSYTFAVAAINAVGTGGYSVSAAVTPLADRTSFAIAASKTVGYGKRTTVTGRLKDATTGAGQAAWVLLRQRSSARGAWTKVAVARTSATGAVKLTVRPAAGRQYQWFYPGDVTHRSSSSAVVSVAVTQSVTATPNHRSLRHGARVAVYGTLKPDVVGRRVVLQSHSSKGWKTVATAVVKKQKLPNGTKGTAFVLVTALRSKGTYHLRVYSPAAAGLAAGSSATLAVTAT